MLSIMKLLELQKENPKQLEKLMHTKPLLEFLNNTILGFLYGLQYQNSEKSLLQLPISSPYKIKKSKTLVFDLDETLVTSKVETGQTLHCFEVTIDNQIFNFKIAIRPYAKELLEYLSQFYEIIVFTASAMEYAEQIIKVLDPQRSIVNLILDRAYCYQTVHGVFIKDLRILKDIDLESVLIIDNSSLSYCFQPQNGVPVPSWNGDENDQELYALALYLKTLAEGEDKIVLQHSKQFSVKAIFQLYNSLQF